MLLGQPNAPLDMNTYTNEMWFKSAISASLMNMLLAVEKVSANPAGEALVTGNIQTQINRALNNGVISVGKVLTDAQKAKINETADSPEAVSQVQTDGYWLKVKIVKNLTTLNFEARYTLIYSVDDVVRFIDGTQILI